MNANQLRKIFTTKAELLKNTIKVIKARERDPQLAALSIRRENQRDAGIEMLRKTAFQAFDVRRRLGTPLSCG